MIIRERNIRLENTVFLNYNGTSVEIIELACLSVFGDFLIIARIDSSYGIAPVGFESRGPALYVGPVVELHRQPACLVLYGLNAVEFVEDCAESRGRNYSAAVLHPYHGMRADICVVGVCSHSGLRQYIAVGRVSHDHYRVLYQSYDFIRKSVLW